MKNQTQRFVFRTFLGLVLAFGFSANAQKKTIEIQQLPVESKLFLTKHFSKQQITSVTEEKDGNETKFTALLANGTAVEFDKKGNWEEVDGNNKPIPTAVIPATILTHLKANYPKNIAVKIDKGAIDYEIKLDSNVELKFALDGKFLRIDD